MSEKAEPVQITQTSPGSSTSSPTPKNEWDTNPANPRQWSRGQKFYQIFGASLAITWLNFTAIIYISGREALANDLHVGTELSILPMAMMTLGSAIGNSMGAPLSEAIGRRPIYWLFLPVSTIFIVGSGFANHLYGVAICRLFAGLFAGTINSVTSGGTVADLYAPRERTTAMDIMVGMGFQGPAIAMLIGSFAVQYTSNWRWTAWISSMFAAVLLIAMIPMRETNHRVIQYRLENSQPSGSRLEALSAAVSKVPWKVVLTKPVRMLVTHPVVTGIGLFTAFVFGILYGMTAIVPYIYAEVYHFDLASSGLTWVSWIIGFGFGTICNSLAQKWLISRAQRPELRGKYRAEWALYPAMVASPFVPASLFWVAWTARPAIHYMVPTVGLGAYAISMYVVYTSGLTYLVQFYGPQHGASAAAGARLLSFIFGIAFPLFSPPLFVNLGISWGISVLAFIAVALMPTPWLLYVFGPGLRARSQAM